MKDTSVVGDISDSVVNFLKHGSLQVVEYDLSWIFILLLILIGLVSLNCVRFSP